MAKKGIVLRHKISGEGIQVYQAKAEVIAKLAPPILVKESVFEFDESCVKAFLCLKENLVLAPIIGALDWIVPFELICDASSVVLGVVFGQRKGNLFHTVYYARKTLNVAQRDYTVTEQELLAVVYAFEKFRAYLLGTVVVHTNHSVICYLMAKKNAIPRLIRWVLLLKEFDFEAKGVVITAEVETPQPTSPKPPSASGMGKGKKQVVIVWASIPPISPYLELRSKVAHDPQVQLLAPPTPQAQQVPHIPAHTPRSMNRLKVVSLSKILEEKQFSIDGVVDKYPAVR
ncbi:hypothetical protein MTR67_026334 [Solanum verrucosum]|uniref:Reverse transcriptase RNase H-like domain-containing protein n=1 Tax=Solanum verrucosum TaxID=315347 RepID=A0AAF0TUP8_SOLVR|nr:hypothetical protein MTR67_026334 [Solanum verrucosum]